jgi:hypothetical protein
MNTKNPLPQRRFQLQELINTLYRFDYFTAFSDDHNVYSDGLIKEEELKKNIDSFKLTKEEKELILRVLGYRYDANYLESLEFYNCIAKDGLWSQNNPVRPRIEYFLRYLASS